MISLRNAVAIVFAALLVGLACPASEAFGAFPRNGLAKTTSLNGFGKAFSDAFKNDDSLGKRVDPGLKGGAKFNEQVTINGKPAKAVVGQPVKTVASAARVKIPYNCQNGECGTCMIKMNGRKVKACVTKIPAGRCTIETL